MSADFDPTQPATAGEFLSRIFKADFMPHGHCFFWRPEVLWLNVISDILIGIAYYSIPLTLLYFIIKRRDIPFHWMFVMFGAFIFLCGTTHLVDVWTTWSAVYRLEGIVKLMTAVVSLTTAVLLIPLIPRAIAFPSIEKIHDDLKGTAEELTESNNELERFNRLAVGREMRVIELKREVNGLCEELGRRRPYNLEKPQKYGE